jgi:hypothetical protein
MGKTLPDWLRLNNVNYSEFGVRIGRSRESVRRYCSGEAIPDRDAMPRIYRETAGEVEPNAFYDLPKLRQRRAG